MEPLLSTGHSAPVSAYPAENHQQPPASGFTNAGSQSQTPFSDSYEHEYSHTFGDSNSYHLLENTRFNISATPHDAASSSRRLIPLTLDPNSRYSSTNNGNKSKARKQEYGWRLVLASLLLSLCSFLGAIALLIYSNNRLLDEWTFFFSLNTMTSILGAFTRAPLGFCIGACLAQAKWIWFSKHSASLSVFERFEDASRGSLGSFWLVLWLHVRHWTVLGAVLTVLLLGFEPFLQAIISFEGQAVVISDMDASPSIGMSTYINAGVYSPDVIDHGVIMINVTGSNSSTRLVSYKARPDPGSSAALFQGLRQSSLANSSKPAPLFFCPTGNCTWPLYTSLAVCTTCNDVSEHLIRTKREGNSFDATLHRADVMFATNLTSYSLPYVNITNADEDGTDHWASAALLTAATVINPGMTITFRDYNTMIAAIGIIKVQSWNDGKISATECAWRFCTKTFSSQVENGILQENITEIPSSRVPESYMFGSGAFWSAYERENNYSLCYYEGNKYDNIKGQIMYDVNGHRNDLQLDIATNPDDKLPNDAITMFNITQNATCGLSTLLGMQLSESGQVTWPPDLLSGVFPPVLSEVLYNTANISLVFQNIADSLTTWMRSYPSGSPVTRKYGTSNQWLVYIRVQWQYLVLPVIALIGSIIFTFLTIISSSKLGLQPWKSDLVATLTHSVDDETRVQLRSAHRDGHLKETAHKMAVQLADDGLGLELKPVVKRSSRWTNQMS